ncbi:hypothetical protein BJ742DRAFT_857319, partial [Cladochytrium replicatum]
MVGDFEVCRKLLRYTENGLTIARQRSVNKSTSKKLQPLKPKHVHGVMMTSSFSPGVVNELFRIINYRIRKSHWVVTFKALIVVHMLMREGDVYRVFQHLATSHGILNVTGLRDKSLDPLGASQFRNIRLYAAYLEEKEATESLAIYKRFASQTTKAVEFFDTAKSLRGQLGIEIPTFNHAPLSLTNALDEYLRSPDFEAQRQAYKDRENGEVEKPKATSWSATPSSTTSSTKSAPKARVTQPNPDTFDFFTSINQEVNQLNVISQNNANIMKQFDGFAAFGTSGLNSNPFPQTNPFGQGSINANFMAAQNLQMQQQLQLQQQQQQMRLQQQIQQQQQLQQNQLLLPRFGNAASINPFMATGVTGLQSQNGLQLPASSPQPNFNTIDFTPENVFSNLAVFSSGAGTASEIAPSFPSSTMRVNSLPMAKTPSAPPALIDPFGTLSKASIRGGTFPASGAYPGLNNVANTNPFAAVQIQQQQQRSVSMPVPSNNPLLQQNNFGNRDSDSTT